MTLQPVQIHEARRLAKEAGADRLVIFYVTEDGKYGVTSYGRTKSLCAATRRWVDRKSAATVIDLLQEV